jgi:hypothetical protein
MEDPYVRRHSLLVYPEATRNLTDKPYVLKHGFTKVNSFNTHPFKECLEKKNSNSTLVILWVREYCH